MLLSLHVENFAIIDNIDIIFKDKMTVLTGETGAGKSLIIDAIGLLLGNRADSNLVRFGEEKAIIEGVFTKLPEEVMELTNSSSEDYLVIRREITSNGKSVIKINNQTITLKQLTELSELIGDIHTQFDTQRLFHPKNYLSFLDDSEVEKLLINYKAELKSYNSLNKQYLDLLNRSDSDLQRLDFLKFQLNELKTANLDPNEEEELKQKSNYLMNYENILNNINQIEQIFESGTIDNLYSIIANLTALENIDSKFSSFKLEIENAYYSLQEISQSISKEAKIVDFDQNELDYINERLGVYSDFKRKYKKTTKEILEYCTSVEDEINSIENYDELIVKLEKQVKEAYSKTLAEAMKIREKRLMLASDLEKNILSNLSDLKLKNTKFSIEFNELDNLSFKTNGIDEIDFLISFNIGEPIKPLSKVVSGGESSRFMLALKVLLIEKLNLQTIIFDEIDSGVSGEIAYSIAGKIKELSKKFQILCVTHLPQVAAISDQQLNISKEIVNKRTVTIIEELSKDNRVIEIAKMISNGVVTEASKNLAIELLK